MHFTHQRDWAKGGPHRRWNLVSECPSGDGAPGRGKHVGEEGGHHWCQCLLSSPLRAQRAQKCEGSVNFFSAWAGTPTHLLLPLHLCSRCSGLWTHTGLKYWLPRFSGLQAWAGTLHQLSRAPSLPTADPGTSQTPQSWERVPLSIDLYVSSWFYFPGEFRLIHLDICNNL